MKIGKMLITAVALSLFGAVFAGLTCGWLFNWVYKLEPTNVWKPMQGPPGMEFHVGAFLLNIVLVVVYVLLRKGLPGNNRLAKGFVFGLCVWAVGILPGMFATYYFMTVAAGVVVYWTVLGLVEAPLKGLIIAAIYGD
ncbi:MAG: hypothetical protein PHX20_02430 [Candidatus Omnitrophica bacterium]|nr:hypothetical protein [Candidatus Omnitrophota bacterium]MDD5436378.1 hypothetical protein [Candidatus Omnitrophota bacterium]